MTEKLTDEQLWQLCLEEEKKKRVSHIRNEDQIIDWEFWSNEFERTKNIKQWMMNISLT